MAEPVNFTLLEGEQVAVVGPNGAGKSMFIDIVTSRHPLIGNGVEYDFSPNRHELNSDNIKYITFRDSVIVGDTLHTIGVADYRLSEPLYFSFNEKGATSMVQNRGKGIFTLYHMNRVRNREDGTVWYEPQWDAAVISVFPGADSLLICRGNTIYEAYTAE